MYYIGERFGRLTVISHHHKQKQNVPRIMWLIISFKK